MAMPMALYWTVDTRLGRQRRILLCAGVGLLAAALGWWGVHANGTDVPMDWYSKGMLSQRIATVWLITTATHLAAGLASSYSGLISLVARNALCSVMGAVLVGIVFIVMWSGNVLLQSVNISAMDTLLSSGWFVAPLATTAFATGFLGSVAWRLNFGAVRHIVFRLADGLLIVVTAMASVGIAGAAIEGLDHEKRISAGVLLWFTTIAVALFNAASVGRASGIADAGNDSVPAWSRTLRMVGWLAVAIVWGVAVRAVWMRVGQYGLTVDRVWSILVCAVLGVAVLGYLFPWRRGLAVDQMRRIGQVNVVALITGCLGIALLLSPIADIRRLVVNDQVALLLGGKVRPDKFDYKTLRFEMGRRGRTALAMLSDGRLDESTLPATDREQIRHRASAALTGERYPHYQPTIPASNDDAVTLLPQPSEQGLAFVAWLRQSKKNAICFRDRLKCAAWAEDMDGDGLPEMVLAMRNTTEVYRRDGGDAPPAWELVGFSRNYIQVSDWIDCFRNGRVTAETSRLKRLRIGLEKIDFEDPGMRKAWPNGKTLTENCKTAGTN